MKVVVKEEAEQKLSAISTKTYPKGWTGDVPDSVGQAWIDAGKAERVDAVAAEPPAAPPAEDKPKGKGKKAKSA